MAKTFVLQATDAKGSTDVYYVYPDGTEQKVNKTQDLYLAWLAAGNKPDTRPYVAPDALSLESRIAIAEQQRRNRYINECDATLLAIQAYLLEEDTGKADALKAGWLAARTAIRKAIPLPEE